MATAAIHSSCKMTTDTSDRASNPDKGLMIVKLVTDSRGYRSMVGEKE